MKRETSLLKQATSANHNPTFHYARTVPTLVKPWIISAIEKPPVGLSCAYLDCRPDQCGEIVNGLAYLVALMRVALPSVITSIYLSVVTSPLCGSCLNLALITRFSNVCLYPLVYPRVRWRTTDIVSAQVPNLRKKS